MLYLVGLGLGDAKDITVKGLEIVKKADIGDPGAERQKRWLEGVAVAEGAGATRKVAARPVTKRLFPASDVDVVPKASNRSMMRCFCASKVYTKTS